MFPLGLGGAPYDPVALKAHIVTQSRSVPRSRSPTNYRLTKALARVLRFVPSSPRNPQVAQSANRPAIESPSLFSCSVLLAHTRTQPVKSSRLSSTPAASLRVSGR